MSENNITSKVKRMEDDWEKPWRELALSKGYDFDKGDILFCPPITVRDVGFIPLGLKGKVFLSPSIDDDSILFVRPRKGSTIKQLVTELNLDIVEW